MDIVAHAAGLLLMWLAGGGAVARTDPLSRITKYTALDVQEHSDDYAWLAEHIDPIYRQISNDINYDHRAAVTIELLNAIMPYALTRPDYRRWDFLLYDALSHAMILRDEEYQIQIWSHLGSSYLQYGQYRSASDAFGKALTRVADHATPELHLLARIGMLRVEAVSQTRDIQGFIAETLAAAQAIVNYRLLAKLHYTLALVYLHQAETCRALGHGQMALCYWHQLGNDREVERTLLLLAEACRVAMRPEMAARYLEQVTPGAGDTYRQAAHYYQQGAVLLESGHLTEAESMLQRALSLFKSLDFPYYTGASHHTLGLTQTKLGQYAEARRNLRRALIIWQKMDNRFQQANAVYALGFLDERMGNRDSAGQLYKQALALCERIPDSPLLRDLRADITRQRENLFS
ncbi:MAG TPA: tetratricopeptide repeat protein [Spirillospora sp.]|nr:tetratricopeptide repeat protein [Spirillospora sp.]